MTAQANERRKPSPDMQHIISMITELGHKFELFVTTQEDCHKVISDTLSRVTEKVEGNGKDGLDKRVDRLEIYISKLDKNLNTIMIGIIMLLVTGVVGLLIK